MKNKPKARYTDIVVSDYKDELLLYDLKTHKCHSLNKTAASVWQVCDGNRDVTAIAEKLFAKAPKGERDKLVLLALNELTKAGLIETDDFAFRPLSCHAATTYNRRRKGNNDRIADSSFGHGACCGQCPELRKYGLQ